MTHQSPRIYTFDLLRGVAVLTMMLAHSVYFFHNRDNTWLLGLENFGNTVSFVTFLVVSGAVTWVAYYGGQRTVGAVNRRRVFSRIILFLIAYYALAFVVAGTELLQATGFDRLRLVTSILSFRFLPGFTEYFPPFIFYSALIGFFPGLFAVVGRSIRGVILVSMLAYLVGYLLYQVPVDDYWQPWMALLVGAEGFYRFPLLQYLPVFLLGLYWGHETLAHEGLVAKQRFVARLFWYFAFLAAAAYPLSYFTAIPLPTIFLRWPPSLPFLALGLGFAFFGAVLLYAFRQLRRLTLIRDFLLLFGQNAIGIFWSHIFLLGLYADAGGPKVSSVGLYFFLFGLLVILTLALATFLPFNFRLALTSIRRSHEEEEEALEQTAVWRLSQDVAAEAAAVSRRWHHFIRPPGGAPPILKKRYQLVITAIALVTAALVIPAATEELAIQRQERAPDIWWSNDYPYRQRITVVNPEAFVRLRPATPVAIQFDHHDLVTQEKSRPDGLDLKVIYWTGEEHILNPSAILNPDTDNTTLTFRLPVDLDGGRADQYFSVYYGGLTVAAEPLPPFDETSTLRAQYRTEEAYPVVASLANNWSMINETASDFANFSVSTSEPEPEATVTYQILGTDLTGAMFRSSESSWEVDIPVGTLPTGTYSLQATLLEADGQMRLSPPVGLHRSAPLYVAWTQDWEGYDVNRSYLDAIEAIANEYQLPITHFFNPRIYVTKTMSLERARSLTRWVQRRIEQGDGYGLHLHLFHDFVEQAGVEVRKEPNWGDRGEGYGVPLSAYSKDEQVRLIDNALDLLFANGMPKTKTFRAGGWYANLDTLAALEELGFTVDSSARTKYSFGRNRLPGHWNILSTTRPYYPSRTNQNMASSTKAFTVLEIPNNGADSYAFSAQAMIDRFTDNFGTGVLEESQQITYLTHPHWFDDKEQAKIRELFTYISRYTYAEDHGPVIFTTTDAIADFWKYAE